MNVILSTAALILAAAPLLAQSETLDGPYTVRGLNPDGSAYEGRLLLEGQGTNVRASWVVAGRSYTGAGPLDGRVLTIDFGDPAPVIYVVMPDGSLHGTWNDGLALERATPE